MVVLLFIVLINALLGSLVFMRNPRSRVNILFLIIVAFATLWAIANYFTDHSPEHLRLFLDRSSFVFPVIVSGSLALFSRIFPVPLGYTKKGIAYVSLITAFGVFISASGLVVSSITIAQDGTTNTIPGSLYNFYSFLVVILLFGYAVRNYIVGRRHADVMQRLQSSYVAYGFLISFFWALIVSVILPIYFPSWNTAGLGPAGTVVFVGASAYAIVRHKLFDIRLVVARAMAYLLTLIVIALVYITPVILLTTFLLHTPLGAGSIAILVTVTFIAALIFQPLHTRFKKVTNRIFYQDAYDPQVFIDQLNQAVIGDIQLESLLKKCSQIIVDNIKTDFCLFALKATEGFKQQVIGTTEKQFKDADIDEVRHVTPHMDTKVIVTDMLGDDRTELKNILAKYNIGVLARLVTDLHKGVEGIGYIVLGYKKSGNPYNDVDIQTIEIIANELVIAIQNAKQFEEIKRFNVTLQEKIDEATAQLQRANKRLKDIDETKDDFISMASHQLRTPLTSMKGYVSMVIEGDAGKITKPQHELLTQAFASSQRMVFLIADLLNVSRLKSGKFVIDNTPTNLATMIQDEITQLTETTNTHELKLDYVQPEHFPTLMLDETKTRQVIMNFIDNAIYYTPKGGHIHVELIDTPHTVECTVSDDGIGVPKAEQHHLFAKFYRAANARKARPDGTGLGLFMAQKVIIAQGGAIIFHSVEGKGSTFGFSFPKQKLAPLPKN